MRANKSNSQTSRREFIKGAAGGLLLAFCVPVQAASEPEQAADDTKGKFAPNAFIRIDKTGKTTLVMPQVEMGQGIYTGLAMILAEELDADIGNIVLEHAPPDEKHYSNSLLGMQATGGSTSVRAFWTPLRQAGATARVMLVQAAAQKWKVDPATCTTSRGEVLHVATNRKAAYGTLIEAAGRIGLPKEVPLKDPAKFVLVGTSQKRFDTAGKVNGQAVYGIDAMVPGMKFATLASCPVFGGKVGRVDDSAAKAGADVWEGLQHARRGLVEVHSERRRFAVGGHSWVAYGWDGRR